MSWARILGAAIVLAGCTTQTVHPPAGDAGPGADAGGATGDIRIEPADAERAIVDGVPAVVDYRAFVTEGGVEREVTSEVTWVSGDLTLGSFSGARFTSSTDRGGRNSILAQLGTLRGTTTLTLRLSRVVVTGGAPPDAPSRFGGPEDASRAPTIVYPSDGVVVPPNMREIELHYRTGGSNLFELSMRAPTVELRVYFGCPESVGGGCIYTFDEDVWETIASAARGAGPITYTLRGTDGTSVGTAASQEITFAEEDITGGLYYWNAGAGRIMRYEWGRRGASAEVFLDRGRTGALMCVGCHSVSRDGTRIAVGLDIPVTTLQVYDVASRTRVFSRASSGFFPEQPSFFSFSPDSTQMVSGAGRHLDIHDATTGAITAANIATNGTMPDWSPDGEHIVYVETETPPPIDTASVSSGSIVTLDWNGSAWTRGRVLVRRLSENNFYPAYSPDGAWVLFNRSPSNTNSMGDDPDNMVARVTDAELWVIASDGTGVAIHLDRADEFAESWPKWDPTAYSDRGRALFWLSFASRRAYGLRYAEDDRSQLWMAAFYADEARGGLDPATPAIRIPFQELDTSNHLPQWVTSIERMTCSSDAQCGGEFCIDGRCYPEIF